MHPLKCCLMALAASLLLVSSVQAAEPVSVYHQRPLSYLHASLGQMSMDFDNSQVDMPTLRLGMGGMINQYVGMEFSLATSLDRAHEKKVTYSLDYMASAFTTVRFPIWRFIYGQAYAGVSHAKLKTISPRKDTERNDDTSLSYGIKVGLRVVPHWRIAAGWSHYIDEPYWKVSAIEGSLQYLF